MNIRESMEMREKELLSPFASFSASSKGRDHPEEECDIRTVYQRDRDRILHCKSFRRLKDKTQVFLAPQGDHYRNRLTHTLEVSQIAFENYSHGRANTIDFQPNGDVFAPFTGIITMIDPAWGWVLFQSLNEVCYADGTEDYMTVGFMHDNDVSDLYAGQIIEQGTPFYQQGGMGNGVPSNYGMHVDMCVYRGAVNRVSRYGAGDTFAFDAFYINRNMTPDIGNPGIAIQPVSGDAPANWTNLWRFIG